MTDVILVQQDDCCCPKDPVPPRTAEDECTGTIQGTIQGTVRMECCCPQLRTRTFTINIGPQTEPQLMAYTGGTVAAWEGAGYLVLAHSIVDTGAGWILSLTVGWYA